MDSFAISFATAFIMSFTFSPCSLLSVSPSPTCSTSCCMVNGHVYTVPLQWKEARIRPIPKIIALKREGGLPPISITPVLTRPGHIGSPHLLVPAVFLISPPTLISSRTSSLSARPARQKQPSSLAYSYKPTSVQSMRHRHIFSS